MQVKRLTKLGQVVNQCNVGQHNPRNVKFLVTNICELNSLKNQSPYEASLHVLGCSCRHKHREDITVQGVVQWSPGCARSDKTSQASTKLLNNHLVILATGDVG